jgi:hypothetical protein
MCVLNKDGLQAVLCVEKHMYRGRGPTIRTSLYIDDAAIFMAPFKEDFEILAHILEGFGEVTGLVTNVHKSLAASIRCSHLDLDEIMHIFPVQRSIFPIKYLGLPLTPKGLKMVDVQPLIDKATSKLAPWYGKFIPMAGRGTLIKSVITSQAIHHITPLAIPPGALQTINKLQRSFFWVAKDKIWGLNAKSIGSKFVGQKRRGVSASSTLTSLQGLCELDGRGFNRRTLPRLGLGAIILVTKQIWSSSMRLLPF